MKTIKLKGTIVQDSWDENPSVCQNNGNATERYADDQYTLFHREFEIEVDVSTLRFAPGDIAERDKIISLQKVKHLENEKAKKYGEISQIEDQIKQLLSIESKPIDFDDDIPF